MQVVYEYDYLADVKVRRDETLENIFYAAQTQA
jgi:hypothetical protein